MSKASAEKQKQQKEPKNSDDKRKSGGNGEKGQRTASSAKTALMIAMPIVLAFAIFFIVVLPSLSVPFSTFKSNFLSGSRVAIIAAYNSSPGSGAVLQCSTQLVQVVAHSRNATTIDFFVLNGTACTYPVGGLGHSITLATNTSSSCIAMTTTEPTLFLNYSATNSTRITPYRLYVNGNAQYMASCPIAIDLS